MSSDSKITVMIVDDAPDDLLLLNMVLEKKFRTIQVDSGEECLALIKVSIPDILLLDVNMRGVSGYEVCKILRATEATKNLPIIFISGMLTSEQRAEGFDLGANEYLNKPVDSKELFNKILYQLSMLDENKL